MWQKKKEKEYLFSEKLKVRLFIKRKLKKSRQKAKDFNK